MRRARRIAGALLALAGAGALADAVTTVVWQEPIGALQAKDAQHTLQGQYAALTGRFEDTPARRADHPPVTRTATDRQRRFAARRAVLLRAHDAARLDAEVPPGRALGRLRIPRMGLSDVWVQGTDAGSLAKGPGHYPGTVLPGRRGTFALAGHRTTHGAPFRHLDRLRAGDRIEVTMPYGAYHYVVEGTQIVAPSQVSVLRRTGTDRLVLTACHPLWSAAQRIVVTAKLVQRPGRTV